MFNYVPDVFRAQYAETEERRPLYSDPDNNRRPPELLPGRGRPPTTPRSRRRGTPHAGYLDIASRLREEILRRCRPLPPVQELRTWTSPRRRGVGRQHYVMAASRWTRPARPSRRAGLFAAARCPRHARLERLGATPCPTAGLRPPAGAGAQY